MSKEARRALHDPEKFRKYLEQDETFRFIAKGFGIGADGTISLLPEGFLASFAAMEAIHKAA